MSADSFTLNPGQRAALQAAIARRAKAARLEHYREQARLAATPDYFQHMEHAARFVRDLRGWCQKVAGPDRYTCELIGRWRTYGCDPREDVRGLAA